MLIGVIVKIMALKDERVLNSKCIEVTLITDKATPLSMLHAIYILSDGWCEGAYLQVEKPWVLICR